MADTLKKAVQPAGPYDTDFYAWSQGQAELLRRRRFSELDIENLIEEVGSVGRSQRSEIRNRLTVLLAHLLKWQFQPDQRKYGWRATIMEQRGAIDGLIEDSPSLRAAPAEMIAKAYIVARSRAELETDLFDGRFPAECPYTIEQALDPAFLPEGPL